MTSQNPEEPRESGLLSPTGGDGTVEVVRTYLRMESLAQLQRAAAPSVAAHLERIDPCPVDVWRSLYAEIGGRWHWHDRDAWTDPQLEAHLASSSVRVYHLRTEEASLSHDHMGFLELERHSDQSVEIVYLGLHPRVFGLGLGAWLVGEAVGHAFAWGASSVWLHTCTLDSPAAMPNYRKRGFVPQRTETYFARLAT
jgi:GNAT superfamily N-acetyltransferase